MTATGQPDPDVGPAQEGTAATVRGVALLVRFLLELALYVAVASCVYTISGGWWRGIAAGAAVVAVGVVWSRWLSRRAPHRPSERVRVLGEVLLFVGCGAALATIGRPWLGVALAAAWAVDRLVLASVRPAST
jgi:hypothetical protein